MQNKMNLSSKEILSTRTFSNLKIISGKAWITVEDDYHDYILNAGDEMSIALGKLLVVQSLQETEIGFSMEDNSIFMQIRKFFSRLVHLGPKVRRLLFFPSTLELTTSARRGELKVAAMKSELLPSHQCKQPTPEKIQRIDNRTL